MRTLTSKFDSKCRKCGQLITRGSLCKWEKGYGAEHVTCPEALDVSLTLNGDALRERLTKLGQQLALQQAVLEDRVAELTPAQPAPICPHCEGKGYVTHEANVSDTSDYSDWQHFPCRCGDTLKLEWHGRDYSVLVNGELATCIKMGNMWLYVPASDVSRRANRNCIEGRLRMHAWARHHHTSWEQACAEQPAFNGTRQLISWCQDDLNIKRGDVVEILNRGKPYVGRVVWVGLSEYGAEEMRVKVELTDGTSKGGALETAKLISREARFSAVKPS